MVNVKQIALLYRRKKKRNELQKTTMQKLQELEQLLKELQKTMR